MNGSSPALANSLQSSIQVNSTAMGLVGYRFASSAISFYCIFWEDRFIVGSYVVHKGDRIDKKKPSDAVIVRRYKGFLDVSFNQIT